MLQPSLQNAWQRLHSSSQFYWQLLATVSPEELMQKPANGGWSLLQVMEHLVGVEEGVYLYLQRKQYTPLETRSKLPASIRSLLLNLALKSPLKFKVPTVLEQLPPNNTDPKMLLARWQKIRTKLLSYLEQMPAEMIHKLLFRHPKAGPLNMQQTLEFMKEHLEHHKKQVNRLLAASLSKS